MTDLDKIKPGDKLECTWEYKQATIGIIVGLGHCVIIESIRYVTDLTGFRNTYVQVIDHLGYQIEIAGRDIEERFRPYVSHSVTIQIPVPADPLTAQVFRGPSLSDTIEEKKVPYEIDLDWEDYDYHGNLQ